MKDDAGCCLAEDATSSNDSDADEGNSKADDSDGWQAITASPDIADADDDADEDGKDGEM